MTRQRTHISLTIIRGRMRRRQLQGQRSAFPRGKQRHRLACRLVIGYGYGTAPFTGPWILLQNAETRYFYVAADTV